MADSVKREIVKLTYVYQFGPNEVEIDTATTEADVCFWIDSIDLKREDGTVDLGMSSYWRNERSNAHTLALCYAGKNALVLDLEALKEIPEILKLLMKNSKVYGRKAADQLEKLSYLGVEFKTVKEINKNLKNLVDANCSPAIADRRLVKTRVGDLSEAAAIVAAYEAFACYAFAKKLIK